jgi:cell division protein FtsW
MIYLQALANMCVAVGVLPVTGQTLPFISYGGTAYLFLGCGLGVIQSVAADVYDKEAQEKASAQAVATGEVRDETTQETTDNDNDNDN